MSKEQFQRGQLSQDMKGIEGFLPSLINILEARPGWYGSVYVERKSGRGFMADLRKTRITDQINRGAVLRIYDGYTLFERATDGAGGHGYFGPEFALLSDVAVVG